MKKICIVIALAANTIAFAQDTENKNKAQQTTITKTTVTDNKGTDVSTTAITTEAIREIAVTNKSGSTLNQAMVMKPVKIDTKIMYNINGSKYKFEEMNNNEGYRFMKNENNTMNEFASLRPSSQQGYYIISTKDKKDSFGYFNQNGDFVVERYDPSSNAVMATIYKLNTTNSQNNNSQNNSYQKNSNK